MPAHTPTDGSKPRRGLPLAGWVMIIIPLTAVVASFVTYWLAARGGDAELPATFPAEGPALDRGVAQAARAAELGISARLDLSGAAGECQVELRLRDEAPGEIRVALTHATKPQLDRLMTLVRHENQYVSLCQPLPEGHWYVTMSDSADSWRLRTNATGSLNAVELVAAPTPAAQ
ncbi:MAG: FixH family protein [Steroidobacteraceae bacterium]|nr:FixH family protein [Steroidobacteraceae bacterium]